MVVVCLMREFCTLRLDKHTHHAESNHMLRMANEFF